MKNTHKLQCSVEHKLLQRYTQRLEEQLEAQQRADEQQLSEQDTGSEISEDEVQPEEDVALCRRQLRGMHHGTTALITFAADIRIEEALLKQRLEEIKHEKQIIKNLQKDYKPASHAAKHKQNQKDEPNERRFDACNMGSFGGF